MGPFAVIRWVWSTFQQAICSFLRESGNKSIFHLQAPNWIVRSHFKSLRSHFKTPLNAWWIANLTWETVHLIFIQSDTFTRWKQLKGSHFTYMTIVLCIDYMVPECVNYRDTHRESMHYSSACSNFRCMCDMCNQRIALSLITTHCDCAEWSRTHCAARNFM